MAKSEAEIEIKHGDLVEVVQQLRSLQIKMKALPTQLIEATYTYWVNSQSGDVSYTMLDSAGDIERSLLFYFDLCYRLGKYGESKND